MFNKIASADAAALLASAAHATITIAAVAVAGSGQTSISTPGQPAETVFAGLVTLTSGTTDYLGFCVDIAHNISIGTGQALGYDLHPLSTDFSGETLTSTQIDRIFGLAALGRTDPRHVARPLGAASRTSDAGGRDHLGCLLRGGVEPRREGPRGGPRHGPDLEDLMV